MASSIDASTSGAGGLITTADNTGTLNLQSGGTTIATISSTGLAVASGKTLSVNGTTVPSNIPAFYAYNSANQSISAATFTKITLDTESFDTNSNFLSSRFTPTVAGYYQINASICFGTAVTIAIVSVFKNGVRTVPNENVFRGTLAASSSLGVSLLLYMNGSTDYLELYAYSDSTGNTIKCNGDPTWLTGVLVRGA